MLRPYYEADGITIYHGDCRDVLPLTADTLVTDPPYPNNAGWFTNSVAEARTVLAAAKFRSAIVFWTELAHPPVHLPLVAVHIWHRNNVNGRPYEAAFHFDADGGKRRSEVMAYPAIFDGAGPGTFEYEGHPTQKPVVIMRRLIEKTTGTVLDPFMGVGSTLVAAKILGRRAIGIEIEERYCETAVRRLAQQTLDLSA